MNVGRLSCARLLLSNVRSCCWNLVSSSCCSPSASPSWGTAISQVLWSDGIVASRSEFGLTVMCAPTVAHTDLPLSESKTSLPNIDSEIQLLSLFDLIIILPAARAVLFYIAYLTQKKRKKNEESNGGECVTPQ